MQTVICSSVKVLQVSSDGNVIGLHDFLYNQGFHSAGSEFAETYYRQPRINKVQVHIRQFWEKCD